MAPPDLLQASEAVQIVPETLGGDLGGLRSAAMAGPAIEEAPAEVAGSGSEADAEQGDPGEGTASGPGRTGGISAAGLPAEETAASLDGLPATESFGGLPLALANGILLERGGFGTAFVRSLRVAPRSFSAETAGAGAVIAMQSLSGEARFHAGAFTLLRSSTWAAANPFSVVTRYGGGAVTESVVKPQEMLAQFGGHAAGPVPARLLPARLQSRVQGAGSAEAEIRSGSVVSAPASPGFFLLSATQRALLGTRGVTGAQAGTALAFLDSLMGPVDRSGQGWVAFGRLDLEPASKDHLSFSWRHHSSDAPAGAAFGSVSDAVMPYGRASVGDRTLRLDAPMAGWQHTFSQRWTNDLRAGFVRDFAAEQPRAPLPQEPAIAPGGFAPEVSIGPEGFTYGTPAALGRSAYPDERRVEVAEVVERTMRWQVIRAGLEWSRVDDLLASETNADGTFRYDSGTANGRAGGLADWITDFTYGVNSYPNGGCPAIYASVHRFCFRSFSQTFGAQQTEWVTHEFAAFAQDAWRLRDNLLLTAGARWEYTLLPLPQQPNAVLDAGLRSFGDLREGSTAGFPEDRNNFGPRFAATWSVRGVEVQLGYGLFFGRLPGSTVRAALANTALPGSVRRIRMTPTTETACPQQPSVGFGYPCTFTSTPPDAVTSTSRATVFAAGFRLPAVQRASLLLQRSLGPVALHVGYAGAMATQLPGSADLNIAPATSVARYVLQGGAGRTGLESGATFAVPLYTARRLPQYGPISAITSSANATYHALNAGARLRWRGLGLHAGYAFSRAIDYAPQTGAALPAMTQFDPFANGYDKGRSSLDVTHAFAGALVWSSEGAAGARWRKALLGGWRMAAVGRAWSGRPYGYEVFGGTYLNGGHESINGAGGARYLPTVGRNTLRLPFRGNADVRVARGTGLGALGMRGGARLEAFAEAFNLLNERNLTRVETRAFLMGTPAAAGQPIPLVFQDAAAIQVEGLNTLAFGSPLSSTAGLSRERQVEFGLRASF